MKTVKMWTQFKPAEGQDTFPKGLKEQLPTLRHSLAFRCSPKEKTRRV